MSDSRLARLLCAVLLTASPCLGQSLTPEAAAQRARVDSLIPEWRAARREMHYDDSVREARLRAQPLALDTAVFGPFMVVARASESQEHFRNFDKAVASRADILRGISPQSRVRLFVERDIGQDDALRFRARQSTGHHVRIFGGSPRARLRFTRLAVDNAMYEFVPPNVRSWLRDAGLSKAADRASIYRELATSSSPVVRACYKEDVASCIRALQLGGATPDSLALSVTARASMLMHALSESDATMWRLMAAADRAPASALEHASGELLPALVRSWRRQIDSSYMSHAGLSRASAAAFLWSIVALLLALRSTRRRAE